MKDWKGTLGEWVKKGNQVLSNNKTIADCENDLRILSETNENARLICDAGNTIQKCGKLPSQILEERNELLNFAIKMAKTYPNSEWIFKEANELINKIQNGY